MVAPLAPHIAEELWSRLGHEESITYEPFPVADPALLVEDTVTCVVQIKGKVRDRLEVPADISEDALREQVLALPKVVAATEGGIRTVIVRAPKLVNVVPVVRLRRRAVVAAPVACARERRDRHRLHGIPAGVGRGRAAASQRGAAARRHRRHASSARASTSRPREVAAALRAFRPVSTSRPSPQAFLRRLRGGGGRRRRARSCRCTSRPTCPRTVESAHLAAQQSPVPVTVVDSRSLGMAMGYAVLSAADAAAAGRVRGRRCGTGASRAAEASTVVFYVDTLEHLRRGGRIGSASAFLGSALAIKPILGSASTATSAPLEKVRTSSRALARLEELAVAAALKAETAATASTSRCTTSTRRRGPRPAERLRERGRDGARGAGRRARAPSSAPTSGPGRSPSPCHPGRPRP